MNLSAHILKIAKAAKQASYATALLTSAQKNAALKAIARALVLEADVIIKANAKDLENATQEGLGKALIDRLRLDHKRIKDMAEGVLQTASLKEPIGHLLETIHRPNGLKIKKVSVPLGVVGIIFESRPNVTADCLALCLKSGNAAILKGGKEAQFSNAIIFKIMHRELVKAGIAKEAFVLIDSTDRQSVHQLLKLDQYIDVIVPRGGESLIRFVAENTRIPVVKHYKGVCHVYVSRYANLEMARSIVLNAKTQKPGVCNAMETLLVDRAIAEKFLPGMIADLKAAKCAIFGDLSARRFDKTIKKATEAHWSNEYLDLMLNVGVVDGVDGAINHINHFGSHHSDAIVSTKKTEQQKFLAGVDSACVYVNASTRFTDGFEFGFGSEVGISTDKLHVRGPMALQGLTSYKYEIYGNGQVRQ